MTLPDAVPCIPSKRADDTETYARQAQETSDASLKDGSMNLSELVGIGELELLCQSFTTITGAVTAIVDVEGNLLAATGWQDICTRFHRAHPATASRCKESDTTLASQLKGGDPYRIYECKNGLVDVAVPIIVEGMHVANFFTGQFFFSPPDRNHFVRQAEEFGFDKEAYLKALDRVPVFSEGHVRRMMGFLSRLARLISEMAFYTKRLEGANARLREHQEHLEELVRERTATAVRAVEERLRLEQSQEYYLNASKYLATVFNSVSEGLVTVDNGGLISGVNVAAARLMNQHPRDLVGRPMDEVIRMDSKVRGFLQDAREYSEEELVLKSQSGPVRCIGSANPIHGENRTRLGAVFTLTAMKGTHLPGEAADRGDTRFMFKDIIGESVVMRETLDRAKRFAKGPSTILILGESGTGKELFAQAVHNASDRRDGPFVSVNCGAIPGELIQSELFGYAEGAFTGAKKGGRTGKLEMANGGSIFLDEIGEMPSHMQVNLLRVLEERAIVRVGGNRVFPVDVRILAATNRSLYEEVTRGKFREDLFYRLNVISLFIPPLRERTGDVTLLIQHFIDRISLKVGKNVRNVEPAALSVLEAHPWPGNVRELANALEYAINMLQGEDLLLSHLPAYLKKEQNARPTPDDTVIMPLHVMEKKTIRNALVHFDGNITKAANALGIGRNTLYDKMKKYGIRP